MSDKLRYDGIYWKLHRSGVYFILRFYRDGKVCSGYITNPPAEIGEEFNPNTANHGCGHFFSQDEKVTCSINLTEGSIDYDCIISEKKLKCQIVSEITGKIINWEYQFSKF